ncbi:MAG: hypothetical protein WBV81_04655, partial [Ignavibacteriaceae bacterium]
FFLSLDPKPLHCIMLVFFFLFFFFVLCFFQSVGLSQTKRNEQKRNVECVYEVKDEGTSFCLKLSGNKESWHIFLKVIEIASGA